MSKCIILYGDGRKDSTIRRSKTTVLTVVVHLLKMLTEHSTRPERVLEGKERKDFEREPFNPDFPSTWI